MSFVEKTPGHLIRRFHQASVAIFHQQVEDWIIRETNWGDR